MSASPAAIATSLKDQGNAFFSAGKYEEALAKYSAAIKIDDSQLVFHSNASQCLLKLKRYNEALQYASKAIEIDATHVKSLVRRGSALLGLSRYTEALSNFETALKIEPTNASIINEIKTCKSLASTTALSQDLKTGVNIASPTSSSPSPKSKKLSALEEAKMALENAPKEVPQAANSFGDFEGHWRTLLSSPELLHRYLLSFDPKKLSTIFKDLMTADMLQSWLETAKILSSDPQTQSHAISLLDNLSKLQRFSLLKMFLSSSQNELVKSIFCNLSEIPDSSPSIASLQSKFLS